MTGAALTSLHWALVPAMYGVSVYAAGHALLHKRDPRAALGWIAVCLTFPLAGPLFYFLFGINRVSSRAARLLGESESRRLREGGRLHGGPARHEPPGAMPSGTVPPRYERLARVGHAITGRPLAGGNHVRPLHNGEQAYPAMLEAIDSAGSSVFLTTYIFGAGETGGRFVDALADATARGVDVRVIVDGVGGLYHWPRAWQRLATRGVRVERFLPPHLVPPQLSVNLRTHRKVLVCDGKVGFTGGMNIAQNHMTAQGGPRCITDLHVLFSGPVVAQLQEAFLRDWGFVTGEYAPGPLVREEPRGDSLCRMVLDGPGFGHERMHDLLVGVVAGAEHSISIMTPYFLPSRELISALRTAALRGVAVSVVLPGRNNLPVVHWATRNILPSLLESGVRVHYQPPPFCHTKLLLIDGCYAHVGSANIDPRSLRLNFELTVEVLDTAVARQLGGHFESVRALSGEVTTDALAGRSLPARLRDAGCWLFSPYL